MYGNIRFFVEGVLLQAAATNSSPILTGFNAFTLPLAHFMCDTYMPVIQIHMHNGMFASTIIIIHNFSAYKQSPLASQINVLY